LGVDMFPHAISTVEQAPRVDRPPVNSMLRQPKLIACHSGAALCGHNNQQDKVT
jgi:hypothetical protein